MLSHTDSFSNKALNGLMDTKQQMLEQDIHNLYTEFHDVLLFGVPSM
jgi:hypothetical protein